MGRKASMGWLACACAASSFWGCASVPKTPKSATPPTSAAVGNNTTIVAIAPAPASSSCTLPQFLGLPALASGTGGILQRLGSRLLNSLDLTGRFPGLQPQPPVLPLTDPANMAEDAPPAVQAAAEIKQEEDAAPQKIMAIRYLASLGCGGCYEKVEDALLEGLSDCTEEVRFEAVKALQCKPDCGCKFCNSPSCCSAKVRKRLLELTTCEKEPSARIRRLARLALACCNTKPLQEDDIPREGPQSPTDKDPLALGTERVSKLFDGIQLVSFESTQPTPGSDMLLATVNGEPIYESQVLPLVEAKLRGGDGAMVNDPAVRRKQMAIEITKVIDWKLMGQSARSQVQFASTNAGTASLSANEIQSWFENRIPMDRNVSPQEIFASYEINKEKYRMPLRVRWERIAVVIDECSSRDSATAIANYLRNRATGQSVEAPAEYSKDKVSMETMGWTDLSNIQSAAIRSALKNMQPGQITSPLEANGELNLIRVLERQEGGYFPLSTVANQIRSDILDERRQAAELKTIALLRAQSQIWTVFDSTHGLTTADNASLRGTSGSVDWQRK